MFVDRTRCCSAMSVIVVTIASALDSNRFLSVRMMHNLFAKCSQVLGSTSFPGIGYRSKHR